MPFFVDLVLPGALTKMSSVRMADSAEIRQRYASMLYKMKSLQLAVNERRHQMQTEQVARGTKRRQSATVRPPKYITALQVVVEGELSTLKTDYETGKTAGAYLENEVPQLNTLVKDLEYNYQEIVRSLYLSADPDTSDDDDERQTAQLVVDDVPPEAIVEAAIRTTATNPESSLRTDSSLPDIKRTSMLSSSSASSSGSAANNARVLVDVSAIPEAPSARPDPTETVDLETYPDALTRGLTALNKFPLRSRFPVQNRRRDSYLKGTNVSYPLHSTFPKVSPVSGRALSLPSIDGASSGLTKRKSSLSRIDSALILKEKAWRY